MSFPPSDLLSAIGLFIVNFGTLEYLTFEYLHLHLGDEEYQKVSKRHFNDRLDLALTHIGQRRTDEAITRAIAEFRSLLQPVRELRNHIAHGYLMVRIDPNSTEANLSLSNPREFEVPYSADSVHLSFRDLVQVLKQLTEATESFRILAEHPMIHHVSPSK